MTKHFTIKELVDPWFLLNHTEAECWAMLAPEMLKALDEMRDWYGPIRINGRGYTESGLRRKDTKTGAKNSTHKSGLGFDLKFLAVGITPQKVFADIVDDPTRFYAIGIRRVEDVAFTVRTGGSGWLHIDGKDTGVSTIVIVKP